jgi:hypothetical protein
MAGYSTTFSAGYLVVRVCCGRFQQWSEDNVDMPFLVDPASKEVTAAESVTFRELGLKGRTFGSNWRKSAIRYSSSPT